jgi:hypothetical protein
MVFYLGMSAGVTVADEEVEFIGRKDILMGKELKRSSVRSSCGLTYTLVTCKGLVR